MSKLYQIKEEDLAVLESELPRILEEGSATDTINRKRWEAIKAILSNVRWNYGPPVEVINVEE